MIRSLLYIFLLEKYVYISVNHVSKTPWAPCLSLLKINVSHVCCDTMPVGSDAHYVLRKHTHS